MMKNRWLLGALLLAPLALVFPLLRAREQRREVNREIAMFLVPVAGTAGCQAVSNSLWISAKEVVCIGQDGTNLEAVDAATGAHRALASLPANNRVYGTFGISVSPDGKWILWPSGKYASPKWSAMTLDGKRLVERPRMSDNISNLRVAWRPDSRGWAEVHRQFAPTGRTVKGLPEKTGRTTLRIYHLSSPKSDDVDVPEADTVNGLQVTQRGEAIIECSGPRLVVVSMVAPFQVKWQITPTAPPGSGSSDIAISPRGDRIAWTFQRMGGSTSESIWLSDLKGTTFERVTPNLSRSDMAPFYLHWTPDGKALSSWRADRTNPNRRNRNQLYRMEFPSRLKLKP